MTVFSVTEIAGFKRCRRAHYLQSLNRLALQPLLTASVYLDLGTLVHKSLASWIIEPNEDLVKLFTLHSRVRMQECIQNYKDIHGFGPSDQELDPLYEAIDMGLAMMGNYQLYHKTALPANMVHMAPEQAVQIPIKGTEHPCETCGGCGFIEIEQFKDKTCEMCNGTGVTLHELGCTFDGLLLNKRDVLFILEHKTYGRRPNKGSLDTVEQFVGYLWALTELDLGPVGGLAYDGMLKKKQPGKSEHLSDLFIRTILDRSEAEIAEYGAMLPQVMMDMASMPDDVHSPVMYYNRRWEGCYDCKVEKLCTAISKGEDWEYLASREYTKRIKEGSVGPVEAM